MSPRFAAPLVAALALAACATAPETRVTRFSAPATPVPQGTIAVEPRDAAFASLEYESYAGAVSAELARAGLPAAQRGRSDLIASVDVQRDTRAGPTSPPPFSIGLGGGSFSGGRRGGGVGLGGGVSLPIGKPRTSEIVATSLFVQIKRAADGTVLWEGRAETQGRSGRPDVSPATVAPRLAAALFKGFPGESGRTIRVR